VNDPSALFSKPSELLMGERTPEFLLESLIRVTVLYAVLIFATRLMGRRLASGLTRNELLATVALAAAMGPGVQDPERGLLPPLIVAVVLVAYQRGVAMLTLRRQRAERLLQGEVATLVASGRINLPECRRNGISRERVLGQVRGEGFTHLGRVERLYLEADGEFTIVPHSGERPGLSAIPVWDRDLAEGQRQTNEQICADCGAPASSEPTAPCADCGCTERVAAVN
jgi:uncharacterized membrane protein YcaP (DUF421 family)